MRSTALPALRRTRSDDPSSELCRGVSSGGEQPDGRRGPMQPERRPLGGMGRQNSGEGQMSSGTKRFELRGINHLALVCRDMEVTVDFYTNVLGMPLVKTIELPAGMGQHFFFDCGGGDCLAFFWFPERSRRRARRERTGRPARPGRPDQRHRIHEPCRLRRCTREDRGVPGSAHCRRDRLHRDRQPRRLRVGYQRRDALGGLRPEHLLPRSRRHPPRVRLLDARLRPHRRHALPRSGGVSGCLDRPGDATGSDQDETIQPIDLSEPVSPSPV